MDNITIQYCFIASEGTEYYILQLDAETLELQLTDDESQFLPPWAKLDFHQCPNCPLTIKTHPYCPLTVNIANIVKRFDNMRSYDEIHLKVTTKERVISQDTTLQRGIGSLIGLVIPTCGCPHTVFLRPMARFHLPLATEEETIYRTTSMYLLAQYFKIKDGKEADFDLKNLVIAYQNIHIVNTAITKRLQSASKTDSTINGLILLDLFAKALPFVIEDCLEEIRYLFEPYFKSVL
jgi:hypothetical protein